MSSNRNKRNKKIDQLCSLVSAVTLLVGNWLLFKYHDNWKIVILGLFLFLLCLTGVVFIITGIVKSKRVAKAMVTDDYDEMSGEEFEEFCADILRGNRFTNVELTAITGDHGIDILANKDGKKYAIQCKRYSKPVGNKAIQEAYSGKDIYKADIAVVMSNMEYTKQAVEDAKKLGVELWDRDKIYNLQRKGNIVIEEEPIIQETEDLVCPKCGGNLVIRTAKRGSNAGSMFYGCSNFPDCRYTRNI